MKANDIVFRILNKVYHHHEKPPSSKLIFVELPELQLKAEEYRNYIAQLKQKGYLDNTREDKNVWGELFVTLDGIAYIENHGQLKTNTVEQEYTLGDYALMQVYLSISGEGEGVTNTNKDEVAGKFGFKGQKFYLEYNKYSRSAQRTGTSTEREDNGRKKRFEKVLKLLAKYPEALERANSEYEEFMASYNKIY